MNDQINLKPKRAERPDKPLFFTMIGAFFLVFSIAPGYWAFYNFGEYNQTNAFIEELKTKSEQFLTPDEKTEKENRIVSLNSRADRYKLEMILSAAGSFALFGIAFLLFIKALKFRKVKNDYKLLDPRAIPIPASRIEVKYKHTYTVLFALIAAFFTAMSLLISYQAFNSQFESANGRIIKGILFPFCLFLIVLFIAYLTLRAKRQSVKLFNSSGITRGDGRQFIWKDFRGTVTQTAFNQRTQRKYVWRIELAFSGGETAWIIPNRIKNFEDIFLYLKSLPKAMLENN